MGTDLVDAPLRAARRPLDHPNARSSHTVATPRGGGVGIVVSFLDASPSCSPSARSTRRLAAALLGSGLVVAVLGFIDDRRPLPARWRFLGHLLAAVWVLYWLGPCRRCRSSASSSTSARRDAALGLLYLVWSINLFNFMDGIDGIASLEAIAVSLGGAFVWWLARRRATGRVAIAFAACVAGFLVWNFPPARIFMGDAGSGFLGCMVATLALWSSHTAAHLFWSWFILGGCFMVDSTVTLVRRVARGERFNEAHRSHAYQYAARRYASTRPSRIAFLVITGGVAVSARRGGRRRLARRADGRRDRLYAVARAGLPLQGRRRG